MLLLLLLLRFNAVGVDRYLRLLRRRQRHFVADKDDDEFMMLLFVLSFVSVRLLLMLIELKLKFIKSF